MSNDLRTQPGPFEVARRDAEVINERLGIHDVAVVLGSGWSELAAGLGQVRAQMQISNLTGSPTPTVPGHSGSVISVTSGGAGDELRVLVIAGRAHLYEGHSAHQVVNAVRAAVISGCRTVVLTNSAGSLRPDVGVGSAVVISDQINLSGANPLCGDEPPAEFGGRFADVSQIYSPRLIGAVEQAYPELRYGIYAGVLGGSYETPAEIRMLRSLGADLVGMSTVLEAIAAHHLGAEVFGVSLVTNLAAGLQPNLAHADVLAAGSAATETLSAILSTVLSNVLNR